MAAQLSDGARHTVCTVVVTAGLACAGMLVAGPAAAAAPVAVTATPGTISTVAGGVGGPGKATTVALGSLSADLCGVSYSNGSLYLADGFTIRRVSQQTDWLSTSAGTGSTGPLGDGGSADSAALKSCAATADHSGNLVIADYGNNRVRVVAASTGSFYGRAMTAGDIYTVAGDGTAGYAGDGGPAASAELNQPAGVTVDGVGNLVIADAVNQRVRVVAARTGSFYGRAMTAGDIYTVAGDGTAGYAGNGGPAVKAELNFSSPDDAEPVDPGGVAVDGVGNLVIADTGNNRVRVVAARTGTFYGQRMTAGDIYKVAGTSTAGYAGDGGPAVKAELHTPCGLAVDGAGNLVIADEGNNRVRVVAARTGSFYGRAMTAGDIYKVAGHSRAGFSGDGGPAVKAELSQPDAVVVDSAGNLVIADTVNYRVRVAAARTGTFYGQRMTAGDIYTVAGDGTLGFSGNGGPATKAQLCNPRGVAVDAAGDRLIADTINGRVRVAAARTGTFYGQAVTAGDIYTVAGGGHSLADGIPATSAAVAPADVTVDGAGNLVITDDSGQRVRVVAASTGTFYGQAMTAGDIYTIAGNGAEGFAGDGGPATSAALNQPAGVAVDSADNLVIADYGNNRVRVAAASTGTFYGQAMTAGDIYTIAGNGSGGFTGDGVPATKTGLGRPEAVALDTAGNLLIADLLDNRVRVAAASTGTFYGQTMTAGDIYTIAGNGSYGFSGDGGPATKAEVAFPDGLVLDGAGNVVVADEGNSRVRVVAASTGSFYGQAMTAGNIYTIAGDGTGGFSGDGGPATNAAIALGEPDGLAVDGAGNLLIADAGNNRVRMVAG